LAGGTGGKRLPHAPHCVTKTQFLAEGVGGEHPKICIFAGSQCKASCPCGFHSYSQHRGFPPTPELKETDVWACTHNDERWQERTGEKTLTTVLLAALKGTGVEY
jgi:hypothetical protein